MRCLGALAGDVGAGDADRARGGAEGAGEEVEERGLAGAVRADQADHLAGGQRDRHAGDGLEAAEALHEVAPLHERGWSDGKGRSPEVRVP